MSTKMSARNPRTGEIDYEFPVTTPQALDDTVLALRSAQPAWQALGPEGRIDAMQQFASRLRSDGQALLDALVTDTGRLGIAHIELNAIPPMVERMAVDTRALLATESLEAGTAFPDIGAKSQLVPYPVVGVISPWNFPLLLSLIDSIPALLAGSTVLLKPSEVTPRFVEPLFELVAGIPDLAAAFAVARGGGETGAALVERVDAVSFTGSVATGRKVAEAAARAFVPAFLEMGGKDPAIVLPSADVEHAARVLLRGSIAATGQACQSIERIYVARSIAEVFVDSLVRQASAVRINHPDIRHGHIGPLIFERQASVIQTHLDDAVARGAEIRCGGELIRHGGIWCPPTVLTGVDHRMKVMTEETFGPVLPVMVYDEVEAAIRLANDTEYGLSGAVFAGNVDEGVAVARHIDGGAISVNDASLTAMVHEVEHDSFRRSGMGRSRMGASGVARYFRRKALLINRGYAAGIDDYAEPGDRG